VSKSDSTVKKLPVTLKKSVKFLKKDPDFVQDVEYVEEASLSGDEVDEYDLSRVSLHFVLLLSSFPVLLLLFFSLLYFLIIFAVCCVVLCFPYVLYCLSAYHVVVVLLVL
jgi:hypothetical protein